MQCLNLRLFYRQPPIHPNDSTYQSTILFPIDVQCASVKAWVRVRRLGCAFISSQTWPES